MAAAAEQESAGARLKITEIFFSIQGEAVFSGWPTVFVRLTGCPLRCQYCDTAYAFTGGEWRTFAEIEAEVRRFGTRYVCVTGGEPLAQPRCTALLTELCDAGFDVSLETSGALDIAGVDTRVARVVDIKTPGSKEVERNRWQNLELLTAHDAVKIVICDRADYDWARAVLAKYSLAVPRVFLAELRGAAGRHARRLDSHGSLARALASAVAQSPMGQRAGALAMTRSVVLLSGGLDSTTALALARARGDECHTLAFDYGQRHRAELAAARRVSASLGAAAHREMRVSLGDSAARRSPIRRIAVPKHGGAGIPVTYVPARNTVFLSLGLALAEVVIADKIVIGVNAVDYSGYPDCRPEYIAAFQALARLRPNAASRAALSYIDAPLITLSKADIIRRGLELGVDYSLTVSCYQADEQGRACGRCDSCRLRQGWFRRGWCADPTRYA